ncbi:spinocerebellar ataxia type 10 protein domain-containing protein [Rhodocollybia butyracea]|uniref:Ataxin-10 homolog n=1 Tax=Rhodocollybia butyracea TaxID=206335 RepID=A0A9P5PYP6_9AGAR|nr:spinocerebellar ataxia type 10 protein domain-containing protein [Rhodocollybia butyracea]
MSSDVLQAVAVFKAACTRFNHAIEIHSSLHETLDILTVNLAKDPELRKQLGAQDIWEDIHNLWQDLANAQVTASASDDSASEHSLRVLCVSLARFTRNLVAGVPENQARSFESEPIVRRLLHYYTSWSSMEDEEATFAARVLTQMLSNIITGNETLISRLWEMYLNLPEDQVVLIRLLAAPDSRILLAVIVMIASCVHESRARTEALTRTAVGGRICVTLLDDMAKLYDADEASDGGRAFDVGYSIFIRIIELGLIPDLHAKLTIPNETVTPHQTTLLKLLDSYLQSTPEANSRIAKIDTELCPMLSNLFFSLSSYAQIAIRKSLGSEPNKSEAFNPPAELDVLLPKVCEALVLVTQCIVTIVLAEQNPKAISPRDFHAFFNQIRAEGLGLVEYLVETLCLLDKFLPRINFESLENPGFNFLKRDLVRLLGILSNEDRAVQDRVRECGGVQTVMNLCVVDERNPYLREHAIFTLRNLLKGNPENQALVEEIKPMGDWDDHGVLRDTPGAVRR